MESIRPISDLRNYFYVTIERVIYGGRIIDSIME